MAPQPGLPRLVPETFISAAAWMFPALPLHIDWAGEGVIPISLTE